MKVMKAKVAVIATLLVAGLVGCGKQRPPDAQVAPAADADGTWCGANAKGPVYINILYAQDGMPSADPDQCTVDPGAEVTWRGPDGNPTALRSSSRMSARSTRTNAWDWPRMSSTSSTR